MAIWLRNARFTVLLKEIIEGFDKNGLLSLLGLYRQNGQLLLGCLRQMKNSRLLPFPVGAFSFYCLNDFVLRLVVKHLPEPLAFCFNHVFYPLSIAI